MGTRKLVAAHLIGASYKRPLIVTDRALGALPVLAEFQARLAVLDVAVFSGVFGNPTCSQVMDGAAAYKAHNADCVIGFGGGAALDVAKVVGVAATHEGDIFEYVWDHPQMRPIANAPPYFVALPTTSGTGFKAGRSSVVSENDTHLKRVFAFQKSLGVVGPLPAHGVTAAHIPRLVEIAAADICHQTNPRSCNIEDFKHFFLQAL